MTAQTQAAEATKAAAIAIANIDPNEKINIAIERLTPNFEAALPAHIPVDRFKRVVLTAVQLNADLISADRKSLFLSCQRCASDGLLPDGREAALVIFNTKEKYRDEENIEREVWVKKVQYMPMVAGLYKKMRNSGEISTITAHVVYGNDKFRYVLGDDERIEHEPHLGEDRGPAIAVYAVARTKDGGIYREIMSKAEVESVRAVSKSKPGGPWTLWWGEMARKTVIRRLSKRLPMSADVERLLRVDDDMVDLNQPAVPRPQRGDFITIDGGKTDDPGPQADPFSFTDTEGVVVDYDAPADFIKRFCDEIAANKTNRAALDGLWEVNSPLLGRIREIDADLAERPHEAMTAATAALDLAAAKSKGWTFTDAAGKPRTVTTEAEFVAALGKAIKAEGFAPPAMRALWKANAEMLARLDQTNAEARAMLEDAAMGNGLGE